MQNLQILGTLSIQNWSPFTLRVEESFGNKRCSSASRTNVKLKSIAVHTIENRQKKQIQPAPHRIFEHLATQANTEMIATNASSKTKQQLLPHVNIATKNGKNVSSPQTLLFSTLHGAAL